MIAAIVGIFLIVSIVILYLVVGRAAQSGPSSRSDQDTSSWLPGDNNSNDSHSGHGHHHSDHGAGGGFDGGGHDGH